MKKSAPPFGAGGEVATTTGDNRVSGRRSQIYRRIKGSLTSGKL